MRTFLLFALTFGAAAALADDASACGKRGRKSASASSCGSCGTAAYVAPQPSCGGCQTGAYYGAQPGAYYHGQPGVYSSYPSAPYLMPGTTTMPGGGVIVPGTMPPKK